MRRKLVITGFTATTLLLGGCGILSSLPFIGGGEDEAAVPEAVPIAPQAAENFDDPLVAEGEPPPPPAAGDDVAEGLIPLADADTVAKLGQTRQGRTDPFSTIPIEGSIPPSTRLPQIPGLPGVPIALSPRLRLPQSISNFPDFPTPQSPRSPQSTPTPQSPQNLPPSEPFAPDLPDLPEPTLAQGLNVTGVVVKADGTKYAIVETSTGKSTYVREGDFVENGQVLVKRIESRKGGTPRVVFEELGIEVTKSLGEGGGQPTAMTPGGAPPPGQPNGSPSSMGRISVNPTAA
ncbi:hypothetical protein PN441_14330 [Spirulina major CS-329]|uniref:hypothetical protein n=1 Tax=Spirulina major TaxID=270636 RepID=UPI00232D798F|nr:hypothetical protein [Spirulina major]MDB9496205.1 hypothetical protein [Spirulina subsalsa CS-330]MDB9504251.1 hypothetical protein [Spirulina major CS-329]